MGDILPSDSNIGIGQVIFWATPALVGDSLVPASSPEPASHMLDCPAPQPAPSSPSLADIERQLAALKSLITAVDDRANANVDAAWNHATKMVRKLWPAVSRIEKKVGMRITDPSARRRMRCESKKRGDR